jgi:hypothetical protein
MAPKIEVRIRRADPTDVSRIPGAGAIRTIPLAALLRNGRRNGHERPPDLLERALVVARDLGEAAGATMASATRQATASEEGLRRVADAASVAVSSAAPRASSLASGISDATRDVDLPAALASSVAALGEVARGLLDELGSEGGRMADSASRGAGWMRGTAVEALPLRLRPRPRRRTGSRLLLVAAAVALAVPLVLLLRRRRDEREGGWSRETDEKVGPVPDGDVLAGGPADGQVETEAPGSGWTIEVTRETDESPDPGAERAEEAPTS